MRELKKIYSYQGPTWVCNYLYPKINIEID